MANYANTVLGEVSADELGVTLVHESLLSVVPGAQYAFDITFDRAEIFETLLAKLMAFKAAGGSTIVDSSGMFHGRDLPLYESLSRASGINIIASTGLGPEENLGGYFLTPQTNPPTPWPAEKFADLFSQELKNGMVRPRLERRANAGLVCVRANQSGTTATEISLIQGGARAARDNGTSLNLFFGSNLITELDAVLAEGIHASQVIVAGLDRVAAEDLVWQAVEKGVNLAIDNIGSNSSEYLTDSQRIELVLKLIEAGHIDKILLSSNSIGVAKGHADSPVEYSFVLTQFVPALKNKGLSETQIEQLLIRNPSCLLTIGAR